MKIKTKQRGSKGKVNKDKFEKKLLRGSKQKTRANNHRSIKKSVTSNICCVYVQAFSNFIQVLK